MSVEATGWAFRQKVPPKPKMVLMALADQTDEKTGRVCYGRTDMAHLAEKSSVPERSLARYIGALITNGYIKRESGRDPGGRQRANSYWLIMDRTVAEDLKDWTWAGHPSASPDEDDIEPQDVVAPTANLADGETGENPKHRLPLNGSSPTANGGNQEESLEDHKIPQENEKKEWPATQGSFSRKAQDLELEAHAVKAAASKAAPVFVLEDSRAWLAWIKDRSARGLPPSLPTCWGVGEYAARRGWYMPSLFPPRSEKTPESLATEAELREFAREPVNTS